MRLRIHRGNAAVRLIPKDEGFFEMFDALASIMVRSAKVLDELFNEPNRLDVFAAQIKTLEHEGDAITHEIMKRIDKSFVTPLDRDDMYQLASALDDICDYVDEAADNIDAYEVGDVPKRAIEQAQVVYRAAAHLHEAVELLEGFG